jgi:hypothetical protein
MVEIGLRLTYSIIIMAGLGFVGFGQQPPAPNWGTMINENRIGLQTNVWAVAIPALLIALLTIGASTFTDAVARVAIGLERRLSRQAQSARRVTVEPTIPTARPQLPASPSTPPAPSGSGNGLGVGLGRTGPVVVVMSFLRTCR